MPIFPSRTRKAQTTLGTPQSSVFVDSFLLSDSHERVFVGMSVFGGLDCSGMSPLSVSPHGSKYYKKEALLSDPVFGPILASLLGEPESREAYAGPVGAEGQILRGHTRANCPTVSCPPNCLHSGTMCLGVHEAQDS